MPLGDLVALVTQIGGTALSAYSQVSAGKQQNQIARANAQSILETAELNATLVEENITANQAISLWNIDALKAKATDAVSRGREDEAKFRTSMKVMTGTQRAGYAAQGVVVDVGSAPEVMADTSYQMERDALSLRVNAAREAWGFTTAAQEERIQMQQQIKIGRLQAKNIRDVAQAQARSATMGGTYAERAGAFGAAATLLGTAGDILLQRQAVKNREDYPTLTKSRVPAGRN